VESLDNISGIDEVLSNGAARDKPSLVRVKQVRNKGLEAKGKAFGMDFKAAILERNGPEVIRSICALFLREEDNIRLVDGSEVSFERVEICEGHLQRMFYEIPVVFIEGRAKAVRARAGVVLHGKKGIFNFFKRERRGKGSGLGGGEGSGSNQGREIEDGRSRERGAKEAFEEGV
jgi:hypothetical protein